MKIFKIVVLKPVCLVMLLSATVSLNAAAAPYPAYSSGLSARQTMAAVMGGSVLGGIAVNAFSGPISNLLSRIFHVSLNPVLDNVEASLVGPAVYRNVPEVPLSDKKVNDLILNRATRAEVTAFLLDLVQSAEQGKPLPMALLYGSPGTGKTEIAKRVRNHGNFEVKVFSGAQLSLSYREMRMMFQWIDQERPNGRKKILVIDEAEELLKASGAYGRRSTVLTEFLKATSSKSKNFAVVATTNFAERIDPAAWERFNHLIHVTLPQATERVEILKYYVQQKNTGRSEQVQLGFEDDREFQQVLANELRRLSGRDIEAVADSIATITLVHEPETLTINREELLEIARRRRNASQQMRDAAEAEFKRLQEALANQRTLAEQERAQRQQNAGGYPFPQQYSPVMNPYM